KTEVPIAAQGAPATERGPDAGAWQRKAAVARAAQKAAPTPRAAKVPAAEKTPAPAKVADDGDAWRGEAEKEAATTPREQEKGIWNVVEAHGKKAREQDGHKPVEKPAQKPAAAEAA